MPDDGDEDRQETPQDELQQRLAYADDARDARDVWQLVQLFGLVLLAAGVLVLVAFAWQAGQA